MTSRQKKSGVKSGDTSGVWVFPWSTDQSTRVLADIKQHNLSPKWLKKSLKNTITCILSLYETTNIKLPSTVPSRVAGKSQTENSKYCKLTATQLSWSALCPMRRYQILTQCGQVEYTTPLYVEKMKGDHDKVTNLVVKSLNEALRDRIITYAREKEFQLTYYGNKVVYLIRGRPDYFALLSTKKGPVALVAEVTLLDTVRHLKGEMSFYMASAVYYTSAPVIGLVIYNKGIRWLSGTSVTELRCEGKVARDKFDLERTFNWVMSEPEEPEERAEQVFKKIKWACSNCDMMNTCPVYSVNM